MNSMRIFSSSILPLLFGLTIFSPASAQHYQVLYSFTGGSDGGTEDSGAPLSSLVRDADGNLYGTAPVFGSGGAGTIYMLSTKGKLSVLHSFTGGADGGYPLAGLVQNDAGALYGTTGGGGSAGFGTVFRIDKKGNHSVLYSFAGGKDGSAPWAPLILDSSGTLYGTTLVGGHPKCLFSYHVPCGTVFKVDASGKETVLFRFSNDLNEFGDRPFAGLLRDSSGNLFGTTSEWGSGEFGTVFKLGARKGKTVLHAFDWKTSYPFSGLIQDAVGNFYGTTQGNDGAVYKLDPLGNQTTLFTFDGTHGSEPLFSGVVMDAAGNLYGTTSSGGIPGCASSGFLGCGVVYKLDPSGNLTVLYQFTGGTDGANPETGVILDAAGNLYGTTTFGGKVNSNCPNGCGVIFKITP